MGYVVEGPDFHARNALAQQVEGKFVGSLHERGQILVFPLVDASVP